MRKLIDCHIHTQRCGHAEGTVEEYVAEAVSKGLWGIAITEHLALPEDMDPERHLSMPPSEVNAYLDEVQAARERVDDLRVVTGVEADYLIGRENEIAAAIARARTGAHGATVVLGSVHFIDRWAFDNPHEVEEWERRDVDDAWRDYFALWMEAVSSELFDVMAHVDLVKKFGHFPTFDAREIYEAAATAAASAGVVIEVSTAGLRKPVGELYPGPDLLSAFRLAGVPATVGSDAHAPAEVGYALDTAYDALRLAGYDSIVFPESPGHWKELSL